MTYDVIVIGSGIAGLMAAIEAKSETNSVAIITKSNIFKSNSAVASGGINAVLDENDEAEIQKHCDDTMKSSKDLGDKKAISYLCHQAPLIIKSLLNTVLNLTVMNMARYFKEALAVEVLNVPVL